MTVWRKKVYLTLTAVLIVLLAIVSLFITERGSPGQKNIAEIASAEVADISEERDYSEVGIPPTNFSLNATLYISDGPGMPKDIKTPPAEETTPVAEKPKDHETSADEPKQQALETPVKVTLVAQKKLILPIQKNPVIRPISPVDSPPSDSQPSSKVKVLNPEKGSKLEVGSSLELHWEIKSERNLTVGIHFSSDGGKTWGSIAENITGDSSHKLTVPDAVSDNCLFRVNAWVDTILLGYNTSPVFSIVSPASSTEKPDKPAPAPTKEEPSDTLPAPDTPEEPSESLPSEEPSEPLPPPPFTDQDGTFISSEGEAVRWLKVEHKLKNVDSAIWQLARIDFPYGLDTPFTEVPGLLASGNLSGSTKEFKLDFNSLMAGVKAGKPVAENKGEKYQIAQGSIPSIQTQQQLYLRVILLDKKQNIVGVTRSGFQVSYGRNILDTLTSLSSSPAGEILVPERSGANAGDFSPFPENGLCFYAKNSNNWTFKVDNFSDSTEEIELQISTQPFSYKTQSDYLEPAGLVHKDRKNKIYKSFYTAFSSFAPPSSKLGNDTIWYYMRAVCYLKTDKPGTFIPIATKTYRICYTGDHDLYMKKTITALPPPPVEVTVESLVPDTQLVRYIPPRFALYHPHEYFEVTRRIRAEEMAFKIKNYETGETIYSFVEQMARNPHTNIEEYQASIDRMLPPGAWFKLTLNQPSGIAKLWNDFWELLTEIYESVQKHYNGLKATVATFVADRCSFLGETAQKYIRSGVEALLNYGLAYIGLPPSLPNFEQLAKGGLDYCVEVALQEAADAMGVPPSMIPKEAREEIIKEVNEQFDQLTAMQDGVNPLELEYLKPAPQAQYLPPKVSVSFFNPSHSEWSRPGSLYIYFEGQGAAMPMFMSHSVAIPSIPPRSKRSIDVYLHKNPSSTAEGFRYHYEGKGGECMLSLYASYNVPPIEEAAKEQGVFGTDPSRTYIYEYDRDSYFKYEVIAVPSEPFYNL